MTKIKEKSKQNDVQTHIDKAFEIIDQHLPNPYVEKTMNLLSEPKPSSGCIRNVRMKLTPETKRLEIVNALLAVALEYKAEKQKLAQLVK